MKPRIGSHSCQCSENNMVTRILILTFLHLLCGCSYLFKDAELSLAKEMNTSKSLRLDGYYINYPKCGTSNPYRLAFLYADGSFSLVFAADSSRLQIDTLLRSEVARDNFRKNKTYWGVYQIREDSIIYEKWYHSSGYDKIVIRSSGLICNDTTYVVTLIESFHDRSERVAQDTFYFRKSHFKPDSINTFIP